MNPAVEKAVADAIPHAHPALRRDQVGACTPGNCWCGAEVKRNVLLAKISLATPSGYVYLRGDR